jgi:TolB protein
VTRQPVPFVRLLQAVLACLVMMAATAQAEITIEISQGVDNPIPVAVVPFGLVGANFIPEDIAQIIGNDLMRSGQFASLPRGEMLSRPTRESDVFYRDWQSVGSEYLVIGSIVQKGPDRWEIGFQLHDVKRGQRLHAQPVTAGTAQLRDAAHYIADVIYERITGVKGAFSTKLLYVTVDRYMSAGKVKARFGLQYADSDGARTVTVLESVEPIMSPTWAPDGKRFAYVSFETGRPAVYIQDRMSGAREKLPSFVGINGAPDWSPDGRYLAMTLSRDGNPELYLFDFQTRELKRLTFNAAIDTEPAWTPDSKSLVFTSSRSGGPQIYRMDIASGEVQRLTYEGGYNARARVTPDGKGLVVVHRDPYDRFRIALFNPERGTLQVLTEGTQDESPSLAPNGVMAVYATQQQGRAVLAAVSVDGRIRLQLPAKGEEVREPAWSPLLK